ncbi:hypothetical protein OCB39_28785 [Bacillus cereus]|nr:hypothetical protein [Bacillus cereus]
MRELEEEVIEFAKFFDEYRKGEQEYYEGMIKKIDEITKPAKEEN